MLCGMHPDHIEQLDVTAADVWDYLSTLRDERALAEETGVADVAAYIANLDWEIVLCRHLYVLVAVTEIASLRGEMTGPLIG
jgi:hypothetical protein